MKKKLFAIILAGVLAAGLAACGGSGADKTDEKSSAAETAASPVDDGVLTVGFDAEYPPFGYMDDNGEYTGFDLELAEAVCQMEGWTLEKKPINWDSKDLELNSGAIDCIWNGFTINGREDDYAWSIPYVDNQQVVVVATGSGIEKLEDLAGKKVGVQAASAALTALLEGHAELTDSFEALSEFADYNTAFTELKAGALDALAIDIGVANYQIANRGEGFEIMAESLQNEQYGVGFALGQQALADLISADLEKLAADGTIAALGEKYEISDMLAFDGE
ncbi:MAG: transporter substrate-binding domain-containing protein [Eubacterium sp.]|nr:transporter substrate-binding domain-containing protein [Eubacterium sp.]